MKKFVSTIILALALTFGTTFAHAGLIVGDRPASPGTCTQSEREGLIVGDLIEIIYQFTGILVADRSAPCADQSRDGLIVGD